MKTFRYIISALVASVILIGNASCSKENPIVVDPNIVGLGGEKYAKTEVDEWLYENFVKPYNMEVKYRFSQFEQDLNKMLVPVREDVVIPVMETIKRVWINPYTEVAGDAFLKSLAPKKYVLVGSPQYNNGLILLGEAEGGRKITIFRLNWFNNNPQTEEELVEQKELIQSIMKTVHHEFVHTMHQITMYPEEFMNITPAGYTASWTNVDDDEAKKLGFISPYACANSNEDFAETISRILVYGREAFNKRVEEASAIYNDPKQNTGMQYDPGEALRKKEAIIITYLKDVWNVDLYDPAPGVKGLETLVQEAIVASLAPNQDQTEK